MSSAAYVRSVILLGAGIGLVSAVALARSSVDAKWWFFLLLTIASSWATLRVPGMPISFSIADTFIFASALVFGPVAGAITAAVDGLVLSFRMAFSLRTVERIAFNASAPAIAIWVAGHAYGAMAGTNPRIAGPMSAIWLLLALMIFGILAYFLNTGIVAVAVGLESKVSIARVWRQHFSALWLNYFGGAFGAMLLTLLTHVYTLDVIILLTPLPIILYTALRHAVGRASDHIGHLGKVNKVYVGAIEALAQAVDAKDQVTHDHVRRVQDRSLELAKLLGVNDDLEMQAHQGRRAAARRGQAGDSRAHPQQAGPAHSGRIRHHEAARRHRRRHPVGHRASRTRSRRSSATTTSTGTARAIRTGSRATRSRSAPGCWRWWTASTR